MKTILVCILILIFPFSVTLAKNNYKGTASGELQVNGKKVELQYSYAVMKGSKLSVILSDRPVPMEALGNYKMLVRLAGDGQIRAVEVVLDSNKKAAEVFFFDDRLPPELSVKEPGPFSPKKVDDKIVTGKLVMNDSEYSFGYSADFSAPVFHPAVTPGSSVDSSMSAQDQAKTGLKNAGLDFDEATFTRKVQAGDAGAVQLFLQAGMPPMVRGKSALWTAIDFKHVEVAKTLIEAGADVNEPGDYGQSMLMRACDMKDLSLVELLIQAGADVNRLNDYGIGPLASSAEQGSKEIVELLLRFGADVNARNTSGGTALQVAVLRGYTDIVKILIDAGADVQRDRKELLEIARNEKHPEVEKLIREAPARPKK